MDTENIMVLLLKGEAQRVFRDLVGWYTGIAHSGFIRDRAIIKSHENGELVIEKFQVLLEGLYRVMSILYGKEAILQPNDVMVILEIFRKAGLNYIREKDIEFDEAELLFSTYHKLAHWEEEYEAAHPTELPLDL